MFECTQNFSRHSMSPGQSASASQVPLQLPKSILGAVQPEIRLAIIAMQLGSPTTPPRGRGSMGRKVRCSLEPMGGMSFLIDWIDDAQDICRITFLLVPPITLLREALGPSDCAPHGNSRGGQDNPRTAKQGLLLGVSVTPRFGTASTFSYCQRGWTDSSLRRMRDIEGVRPIFSGAASRTQRSQSTLSVCTQLQARRSKSARLKSA